MGSCCLVRTVSVFQDGKSSGDLLRNSVNVRNTTERYAEKWLTW